MDLTLGVKFMKADGISVHLFSVFRWKYSMLFSVYYHYVHGCNHICDNFRKSCNAPTLFPSHLHVFFLVNLTRNTEGEVINLLLLLLLIFLKMNILFQLSKQLVNIYNFKLYIEYACWVTCYKEGGSMRLPYVLDQG